MVLVYAPPCEFNDCQKDNFNKNYINFVRKFGEKQETLLVKLEVMKKTIRINIGVMNREGERILEFYAAMKVTVGYILVKSH